MYFKLEMRDIDFLPLFDKFVEITGQVPWTKKLGWIQQEIAGNLFMEEWFRERHGLEMKLYELLMEEQQTGQFPVAVRDVQQYNLYGFVGMVNRIYEQLSPSGQTRLRGMLLDGLKTDNDLLSLQHEISTAVHLMSRGFDIEFHDMEYGSGVDFIARQGGLEIEVECKMFTGDIGRKIHKRRILSLHKAFLPVLRPVFEAATRGIFIRITIPDRLTPNPTQIAGIASAVSNAVVSGVQTTQTPECTVEIEEFDLTPGPFAASRPEEITRESIIDFVREKFGKSNPALMVLFCPRERAIIALVESARPNAVLKGIERQLRESSKGQFTTQRPGILAVQFQELTAQQLSELSQEGTLDPGTATSLRLMTSSFLGSPSRRHIHTVAYRSHGTLVFVESAGALTEQSPAYIFRNPNNPLYDDPRLRVFN